MMDSHSNPAGAGPLDGPVRPGSEARPPVQDLTGDVAWLWTHCIAIGMTRRSDSLLMHHDVALYTMDLKAEIEQQKCQINGLMFDALGEPRTRCVRVTLDGSHCILDAREGDRYVQEAREVGDESKYTVADVYLSEREFDDLPEFDGF